MQETWIQSLGWEDPLEKRKATHSSILAWRIPWPAIHGVPLSVAIDLSCGQRNVGGSVAHSFQEEPTVPPPGVTLFLYLPGGDESPIGSCKAPAKAEG